MPAQSSSSAARARAWSSTSVYAGSAARLCSWYGSASPVVELLERRGVRSGGVRVAGEGPPVVAVAAVEPAALVRLLAQETIPFRLDSGAGLQDRRAPPGGLAAQRRHHRDPVQRVGRDRLRERHDGAGQVRGRRQLVGVGSGGNPRPAEQQRDPQRLLVGQPLADVAVLPHQVAVVGGEDEQGPVELTAAAERPYGRRDRAVDGLQRLDPALEEEVEVVTVDGVEAAQEGRRGRAVAVVEGGHPARRGRHPGEVTAVGARRDRGLPAAAGGAPVVAGVVGSHVRDPGEERRAVVRLEAADHLPGPVAQVVGDVAVAHRGHGTVVPRHERPVGVDAAHQRVEHVPAVLPGGVVRAQAVEVLAQERGAVARLLQPVGQLGARLERAVAAMGLGVGPDPVVVRLLPGQHGGAGRAAHRVRRQALVEGGPGAAQQPTGAGHPPQVARGHVVGHDQHHVGPRVRAALACRRGPREPAGHGREHAQDGEEQREQDSGGHGSPTTAGDSGTRGAGGAPSMLRDRPATRRVLGDQAPFRRSPYVMPSTSAPHDASMTLAPTPTVTQDEEPSLVSIRTRVTASVPWPWSRIRTL